MRSIDWNPIAFNRLFPGNLTGMGCSPRNVSPIDPEKQGHLLRYLVAMTRSRAIDKLRSRTRNLNLVQLGVKMTISPEGKVMDKFWMPADFYQGMSGLFVTVESSETSRYPTGSIVMQSRRSAT
jgi:hypothetical protein